MLRTALSSPSNEARMLVFSLSAAWLPSHAQQGSEAVRPGPALGAHSGIRPGTGNSGQPVANSPARSPGRPGPGRTQAPAPLGHSRGGGSSPVLLNARVAPSVTHSGAPCPGKKPWRGAKIPTKASGPSHRPRNPLPHTPEGPGAHRAHPPS